MKLAVKKTFEFFFNEIDCKTIFGNFFNEFSSKNFQ